eukprot:866716_1
MAGLFLETEIRETNVHQLKEQDVTKMNLNANDSHRKEHLVYQIVLDGENKEKHKSNRQVYFVSCLCPVHVEFDLSCDVGVMEFYNQIKLQDDSDYVSKTRYPINPLNLYNNLRINTILFPYRIT